MNLDTALRNHLERAGAAIDGPPVEAATIIGRARRRRQRRRLAEGAAAVLLLVLVPVAVMRFQPNDGQPIDTVNSGEGGTATTTPTTTASTSSTGSTTGPVDASPALEELASQLGVSTVIVGPEWPGPSGGSGGLETVEVLSDGLRVSVPLDDPDSSYLRADRSFIYVAVSSPDESIQTLVYRHDGTLVCTVGGGFDGFAVNHVTTAGDGGYVAALAKVGQAMAYDCATGEVTPIEPIMVAAGEVEVETVQRVADRVFRILSDAEGNAASIVNEGGQSLVGDDYPGYTAFSPDGSVLAYTDHRNSASPHASARVRVRNTTSGELLGDYEAPGLVCALTVMSDGAIVLAEAAPDEFDSLCRQSLVQIVTPGGELRTEVPIEGMRLLYAD